MPPPPAIEPATGEPPATATGAAPPTTPAPQLDAPPPEAVPPPGVTTLVGEAEERHIRVETADVIAVFTNRGARLKSWRLKRYLDANGEPLEMVATALADTQPLPFTLRAGDEALTATLNGALYALESAPPAVLDEAAALTFEYRNSAGLHAVKEFRLEPTSYLTTFRHAVTQDERPVEVAVAWGPAVGNAPPSASTWARKAGGLLYANDELERLDKSALAEQGVYEGTFDYVGVDDHYFLTVAVAPGAATVTFRPVTIPPPAGSEEEPRDLVAWSVQTAQSPLAYFAGPKDFDLLATVDRDLVRAIDYGIFAVIVVPLQRTLNWLNGYVGNYGWSIVLLTIIINAMMFPLRHKSVVSMRKMQEIQPEAKAIQERYAKLKATDPAKQKMNQELMALYRERGVNPASGCLPMLLTMPVLFAFYSLLTVSIELRGAPFIAWIHDLSQPDPWYVIPVLMGATQIWQQWITPAAGVDPAQQKMMMVMPLVFIAFSLWFPAGVALYWFVSNAWAIGQMYLTNYLIGPPPVRNVRPAAERRVKRVGAGKSEQAARES
jgi:YidC/Oxa1 family membrane protein insertase